MPLLFSYGTLRHTDVQLSTFGRLLNGTDDELVGYVLSSVRVTDAAFVESSGKAIHASVMFNGRADSRVPGVALEVTESELVLCDRYEEPACYERAVATLASGREAWVYAHTGGKSK